MPPKRTAPHREQDNKQNLEHYVLPGNNELKYAQLTWKTERKTLFLRAEVERFCCRSI